MKRKIALFLVLFLGLGQLTEAQIILPSVFADNMVLQQKADVAFWGKAEPGQKVTVSSTWSSDKATVTAARDSTWFARLKTIEAGGPYEVSIKCGKETRTIGNVLLGEVWICSGQSNMEMRVQGFWGQPVENSAYYISSARPEVPIRSCNLERAKSLKPEFDCPARWDVHDQNGVADASATAYFFALRLYETLRIPVGIINVSWGGTPIEAWMSREVIAGGFASEFDLSSYDTGIYPEKNPHKVPGVLYNGMLHTVIPFTAKGFLWYQGCDNRTRYEQYSRLQPEFAKMLREKWGNEDMPFYFMRISAMTTQAFRR